jgi:quercetin dioxygenase-like cupin family protein
MSEVAHRPERPVTREILMDQALPEPLPTAHVEIRRIRMPAGRAAGPHVHNGPVFGNIVEGRVLFQVEGGEEIVLRPGDVFYEPADVPIAHFDALDADVTFLAYFPLTAGQESEMLTAPGSGA